MGFKRIISFQKLEFRKKALLYRCLFIFHKENEYLSKKNCETKSSQKQQFEYGMRNKFTFEVRIFKCQLQAFQRPANFELTARNKQKKNKRKRDPKLLTFFVPKNRMTDQKEIFINFALSPLKKQNPRSLLRPRVLLENNILTVRLRSRPCLPYRPYHPCHPCHHLLVFLLLALLQLHIQLWLEERLHRMRLEVRI